MRSQMIRVALLASAGLLLTPCLSAQIDPTATNQNPIPGATEYPQSPQNINRPSGMPGSTPPNGSQTIPNTSMRDSLGAPGETGQKMVDKQFVRTAVEGNLAEIKLATLALQKGSPEVHDLAQKMVDDHTAMNKQMAGIADSMGIMLPSKPAKQQQAEYEKLESLSGKDFDTEYLTYLAKAHHQDMHAFYMEASLASDNNLQSEIVRSMRTMHQHLGLIEKTAADEGVTLPPRLHRGQPATTASK